MAVSPALEIATKLSQAYPGKENKAECALTPLPGSTRQGLWRWATVQGRLPWHMGARAHALRKAGPAAGGCFTHFLLESPELGAVAALSLCLSPRV